VAQRIESYQVTCPAGTTQANAIEVRLPMSPGIVRQVDLRIPPGHIGLTGIALAQAHQVIIPASGATWIIGNDDRISWELENFLDADTWSAFVYNTDAKYSHSWYVRMLVDEIEAPTSAGFGPIAVGDIYAAAIRQAA
jgi:hypothetical protein